MVTGLTLRLSSRQTLRALEHVDLLGLLAAQLAAGVPTASADVLPGARFRPDARVASEDPSGARFRPDARLASEDLSGAEFRPDARAQETEVEDPETGQRCLLPTAALQLIRLTGLAALAARTLAAPGVVTAAVFGSGASLRLHVEVMAHYLPTLSHIALGGPVSDPLAPLDAALLDQIEAAGIGLSAAATPRQAALGANLFVVADQEHSLDIGALPAGALLVNSSGQDLPRPVVAGADRVYVDDLRLLVASQHREFVRLHLAGAPATPASLLPHREGWYRHPPAGHGWPHVAADLGAVLTGAAPGRTTDDETLLAELLGTSVVDLELGGRLQRAALAHGLGSWVDQP
jgi:ornithine cyclodeaminase/alanine dehydrogenase-like protein (mu-crystallin family)